MKVKCIVIIFLYVILLISCRGEDGIIGPQGEEGPLLIGNMVGSVYLINKYGKVEKEHAGVLVRILETMDSTFTDEFGYWELDSLVTGTYTIEFEKNNYGKSILQSVQSNVVNDGYKAIRIFVGNDLEVSSNPENYIYTGKYKLYNNDYINIRMSEITKDGFKKGEIIYFCVYSSNPSDNNSYVFNYPTGRYKYTDISKLKSNVISYTL